jgi:PAS domain S-box-containing protein
MKQKKIKSLPVHGHADYQMILNSLDVGITLVDRNRLVTFCNLRAEDLTGMTRAALIGKKCCDVFSDTLCSEQCLFQQTIKNRRPVMNRVIYLGDASGQGVPVAVSTALLRDPAGTVAGCAASFRDLSMAGDLYSLPISLLAAAENVNNRDVVEEFNREVVKRSSFHGIISRNIYLQGIFALLPRVALSDSTILIEGPSGSGKELIAQTIHQLSRRKGKPLITVNSGALPDSLLESELFGYKAGAFTDAKRDKPGRIALAEGGTLFLDEIGDISPPLQIRLLRFLQSREYEPLGSTQQMKADVRILAATNRDIEQLVKEKKFREDLYYRINVFKITLQPLAQRKEDIPLLAKHFIDHFNRAQKRDIKDISAHSRNLLINYDFPGNIRELQNIIEHAFILCSEDYIQPSHLPDYIHHREKIQVGDTSTRLVNVESQTILDALKRHNWNKAAAARELGIHKTTLWRKIRQLRIVPPQKKISVK